MAFVVSLNLRRRHLTESQRAMVAAKLANMTNSVAGKIGAAAQGKASANLQTPPVSQSDAAKLLNVSTRTLTLTRLVGMNGRG